MAMSIGKILGSPQAWNFVSQLGGAIAPQNSGAARAGEAGTQISATQIEQDARKKAAEEAEKKKKSGLFGKLGGTAGGIIGGLLAPATGGLSLAIPAAASAVGNVAGQAVGGGGINPTAALAAGVSGGASAGLGNLMKSGSILGKAPATAAVPPTTAATGELTRSAAETAAPSMLEPLADPSQRKRLLLQQLGLLGSGAY